MTDESDIISRFSSSGITGTSAELGQPSGPSRTGAVASSGKPSDLVAEPTTVNPIEPIPTTYPGFWYSVLQGKVPIALPSRVVVIIVSLSWFAFACWIFTQDNSAERLNGWHGIGWWSIKALILVLGVGLLFCMMKIGITLARRFEKPTQGIPILRIPLWSKFVGIAFLLVAIAVLLYVASLNNPAEKITADVDVQLVKTIGPFDDKEMGAEVYGFVVNQSHKHKQVIVHARYSNQRKVILVELTSMLRLPADGGRYFVIKSDPQIDAEILALKQAVSNDKSAQLSWDAWAEDIK